MLVSLVSAAAGQEIAVPRMDAQLFHASVDGRIGLSVDDARVTPDGVFSARAEAQYARDPLVWTWDDGERVTLLSDLLQVEVLAGYTMGRVRAALDVPLYLVSNGDLGDGGVTPGDASIDLKAVALDPDESPVGLAIAGRLTLPTGSDALSLGSGAVGYEISLVGSKRLGDWSLAANVGTRGVPTAELGDISWGPHLVARAGLGRDIGSNAGAAVELSAASVYTSFLTDAATSPVEGMASGWYRVGPATVLRLGAGGGLTPGVGAPLARVVASVGFERDALPDRDSDGLADRDDACVDTAEDPDGFQDQDGCPDADNDQDGLADRDDTCPNDPEDRDAFHDDDGCPDPDNDGDGVADAADLCDDAPEDVDQWEDGDGCPEPTTVRVHVLGEDGEPVRFAEVRVGDVTGGADAELKLEAGHWGLTANAPAYEPLAETIDVPAGPPVELTRTLKAAVQGGTIELRVTGAKGEPLDASWSYNPVGEAMSLDDERVVGGVTKTRVPAGTYLVNVQADGYASTTQKVTIHKGDSTVLAVVLQPARVVVREDRIEILDKIYFDTGRTTIRRASYALLGEIARVLEEHPEVRKVRVEGHTDSRGSDVANLKLSDGRAKAVAAFLVQAGVEASRLTAAGYGETRPLDPTETEVAWEKNRRVEFVIEERE